MKHKFIAIEGNIGAGKTTLAETLATDLGAYLLKEQFEQNPYLESFYTDPDTWALHTELFFLTERFEQLQALPPNNQLVSDYTIYKSLWFGTLNLSEADQLLFLKLYRQFLKQVPQPDLIIYLHRDIDQLHEHINQRGRSFENSISSQYLQNLEDIYLKQLKELKGLPRVIVDGRKRNFTTEQDLNWLKAELEKPLSNDLHYLGFESGDQSVNL